MMSLQEAIEEVKRRAGWLIGGVFDDIDVGESTTEEFTAIATILNAVVKGELVAAVEPDSRPEGCRFRLQDEGKPYPRSSCQACGKGVLTGLGKSCGEPTNGR